MTEPAFTFQSISPRMPAVQLIRHRLHEDRRGTSERVFDSAELSAILAPARHLPESELVSWSKSGVARGMHIQAQYAPQWKHIRCSRGSIHAVVLDARGPAAIAEAVELHEGKRVSLWVPPHCAFGYAVLSDGAEVHYRIFGARLPDAERVIAWDSFGHRWPLGNPVLSDRDAAGIVFPDAARLGWGSRGPA